MNKIVIAITQTPQTNNLKISTESAHILSNVLKDALQKPWWENYSLVISTISAALAAVFALISILIQHKNLKKQEANELLKLFFELTSQLPLAQGAILSAHHKQLLCNYFEYICWNINTKRHSEKDLRPIIDVMKEPLFVTFIKAYRRKHKSSFSEYSKWL